MSRPPQTNAEEALKQPRPIGLADGQVEVPGRFFDDLPDDELALWNGEEADSSGTKGCSLEEAN